MAKKFDTAQATNKFFTAGTDNTADTADTAQKADTEPKKKGRPLKPEEDKIRGGYRYSLNLDKDLKQWLHEVVWIRRTNMTQYINDLIRADMNAYFANGGTKEGWEDESEA